jgi:hypothetical protein
VDGRHLGPPVQEGVPKRELARPAGLFGGDDLDGLDDVGGGDLVLWVWRETREERRAAAARRNGMVKT